MPSGSGQRNSRFTQIPWSGSYDGDVIEVDEANSFEVSGFAIDYVVVFEATRD